MRKRLQAASRVALVHFVCGLVFISFLAFLIFKLWFPYPYNEMAVGKQLFIILFFVDIACGPLLTLILFNPLKERWKWGADIFLILCLQIAALSYGLINIAHSRPVFLAYEGDRFRIVYAGDIDAGSIHLASPEFSSLSWDGPDLVGVKLLDPTDVGYVESLKKSLNGYPPSFRPDRWIKYSEQKYQLIKALKPLENLRIDSNLEKLIQELKTKTGLPISNFGYLPLVQESITDWIVIVGRKDGMPMFYWHVDGW